MKPAEVQAKLERNAEIVRLANDGMKPRELETKFGLNHNTIRHILRESHTSKTPWELFKNFKKEVCNPKGCEMWGECRGTTPTLCRLWEAYKTKHGGKK